jgi:hypothetical protein
MLPSNYLSYTAGLREYPPNRWAERTFDILGFGYRTARRLVPWPNSSARWKAHSRSEQATILPLKIDVHG